MRIFTSIFTVAVAASIAFAAPKAHKQCEFSLNSRNAEPKAEMLTKSQRASVVGATVNGRAFLGKNVERVSSFRAPAKRRVTVADPEVIEDTPEGTPFVYARKGDGFMSFYGFIIDHTQNGQIMNAVFAPDGKTVYIQDPVSSAIAFTWVKGTFDGTKITVPVGQYIMYSPEEGYGAAVYAGKLTEVEDDGDKYLTYVIDESIKEITYNVGADGTVTIEDKFKSTEPAPEYVLSAFFDDDDSWSGYTDYNSSYSPFDDTATALPYGVSTTDWKLTYVDPEYDETGKTFVSVGVDGDKMYIGGLSGELKDSYITGTIKDGKVVFPSNQYLGISNTVYFTYFVGGDYSTETLEDEYGEYVAITGKAKENIELAYDADARTLAAAENEALFVNAGKADTATGEDVMEFAGYYSPSLEEFVEVAATPATPTILSADDLFDMYGCVGIQMEIPSVSTTGADINYNKLYYQIYIRVGDEIEPFVFYSDEYPGLEEYGLEEMTEVPYTMTLTGPDGDDITFGGEEVYFYTTLADAYGVKSIYKGGGETHESPIFWYDINGTTGVKDIITDGQAKVSAIYGVDGTLRSGKTRGLNIVKMSDGSVRKVVVR